MHRFYLVCLFVFYLILPPCADAQVTATYWVNQQGTLGADGTYTCVTDGHGNVYFGGKISGQVNLGGVTLTSLGSSDGFVAKFSISGVLQWAKKIGSPNAGQVNSIVLGPSGELYATGFTNDTSLLSPDLSVNRVFVAKYDTLGRFKWITKSENRRDATSNAITVTPSGRSLYVTGSAIDSVQFGDVGLGGPTSIANIFVARLDTSGVARWARRSSSGVFSGTRDAGLCAASDSEESVFIGAAYQDSINVSGFRQLGPRNTTAALIVSYDSAGILKWAKAFPTLGARANAMCYAAGRLFVTGESAFVTKFESDGSIDRSLQNTGNALGASAIASDRLGHLFLMGAVTKPLSIDTLYLTNLGAPPTFILKIDTGLRPIWVMQTNSTRPLISSSIAVDSIGNRFIAGTFSDSVRIGSFVFGSRGPQSDGFVASMFERSLTLEPPTQQSYCILDTITLKYTVQGEFYAGNTFSLQISDSLGRFTSPPTLGYVYGTSSGTVKAWLPPGLHSGTKYRVRVMASSPQFVTADNGFDILIKPLPTTTLTPGAFVDLCEGDSVTLRATGGTAYRWNTGATTPAIVTKAGGEYAVYVLGANGCGILLPIEVTERLVPPVPALTREGNMLRSSSAQNNQWYRNHISIPGAIGQTYLATKSGYYEVSVSNAYHCSSVSDSVLVDLGDMAVGANASQAFQVFQSATDAIQITALNACVAQFEVVDILGRNVSSFSRFIAQGSQRIAVASFDLRTGGIYYLRVTSGPTVATCRLQILR